MSLVALRYFIAVQLQPVYVRVGFVLLVVLGSWQIHLSPDDPTAPLATLLLWQMFAVSTGFRAAACAGYYDRLLTSGISRGKIAAAHWVASSGPGALAWLAFTGLSVGLSDGMFPASMQPGSLLAWLLVSTLGWAMGLMLPRLGAGIAWVTGILLLGTTQAGLVQMRLLTSDQTLDGVDLLAAGLTVVVCPFVLLGSPPATETPWIRGCAVLIALLALAAGLIRLANSEFPLSAR